MPIYITGNGGNPFEIGYQWPKYAKYVTVFLYVDLFIIVKHRGNTAWLSFIFHDPANSVLRNKRHNMFNRKTIISK